MQTDTRDRNTYFDKTDVNTYFHEYLEALKNAATLGISGMQLKAAARLLRQTLSEDGRIFVGGNGGSAAIADHLCCDFEKGTILPGINNLRTHSLVGSMALFSAIGNDLGYDETLAYQLELQRPKPYDTLILISSSGNSPNIIKALDCAKKYRVYVIGLTGFDGGQLKNGCDLSLHIPINNYGVVEDCHQMLMHVLAQYHYLSLQNGQ